MSRTHRTILRYSGFCIATLLATAVLVLGGLNEADFLAEGVAYASHSPQVP